MFCTLACFISLNLVDFPLVTLARFNLFAISTQSANNRSPVAFNISSNTDLKFQTSTMKSNWSIPLAIALTTAGSFSLLLYALNKRRKWRPVGKLSAIYIYPLKSGKFKEIQEGECTNRGLRCPSENGKASFRDRVFLIYDEEKMNTFTARKCPKLLFIDTTIKSINSVVFSHPEKNDIEVFFPNEEYKESEVTMWNHEKLKLLDCGNDIAKWVSELIHGNEKGYRIGFWPEEAGWKRDIVKYNPIEASVFKYFSNDFSGAFSDLASYHLINQNSVDGFNAKLNDSVKPETLNFRPNFVIEGPDAFAEDKWSLIKIGEVVFRNFRPCTRCVMATINFRSGEKHPKTEPLTTLRSYRTMKQLGFGEGKIEATVPVMGIFLGLDTPGKVKKGDTVYVC